MIFNLFIIIYFIKYIFCNYLFEERETETCGPRTSTPLGSSTSWAPTITALGGLLSDDPNQNPDFSNWYVT